MVVLLGFLCGTILILCVGRNPVGMYKAILQVLTGYNIDRHQWYVRYVGEWLAQSMPFILCGLSMGFAARVGLFNIGGEGQYVVGLTIAQVFALLGPQVSVIQWVVALCLAMLGGALWGGIVGWLKAKYEVSEVVATIMLNYIALYGSRIIMMRIPGTNTYKTLDYPATALLGSSFLQKLTGGSMLNLGFIFVLLAVIIYWFIIEKTKLGFGLRATGFNKDASRCSGIPVTKSIVLSMAISGRFRGVGRRYRGSRFFQIRSRSFRKRRVWICRNRRRSRWQQHGVRDNARRTSFRHAQFRAAIDGIQPHTEGNYLHHTGIGSCIYRNPRRFQDIHQLFHEKKYSQGES